MRKVIACFLPLLVFALLALRAPSAAEQLTFTLDPDESVVQASGYIPLVLANTVPQGPSADVTTYSGTVNVEIDDPQAPTSIAFLGGQIVAADSGSWLPDFGGGDIGFPLLQGDADPGDPQPANYGLTLDAGIVGTLWLALRDIELSATSDPLPVSEGAFSPTLTVSGLGGMADYTIRSAVVGDSAVVVPLVGNSYTNAEAGDGDYSIDAGVATLTAPIDLLLEIEDADNPGVILFELTYSGVIVATAPLVSRAADFDDDGDVDGDDFLRWQSGFGIGTTRAEGDADGDQDVDGDDFLIWQSEFGSGAGSAASAVPEPTACGLSLLLAVLVSAWTVRRRRAAWKETCMSGFLA